MMLTAYWKTFAKISWGYPDMTGYTKLALFLQALECLDRYTNWYKG